MTKRVMEPEKTPESRKLWLMVKNRKDEDVLEFIRLILVDILRSEEPYDTLYSWARRLMIPLGDEGG